MSSHWCENNWYETFFRGITLDLWRNAVTPELTRAEVDFAIAKLALAPGARVLDVPCGNGRHALELAARGFSVVGVDLAEEFIAEARASSRQRQLSSIDWRLADMRQLPWQAEFDAAICLGNSFGYLEHEATLHFLRAVARALKPGGRFLLETGAAAECLLPHLEERTEYVIGDITMQTVNDYRPADGRLYAEDTFIRNGERDIRHSSQAIYTAAEIVRMLRSASFAVWALYGGTDGSDFRLGARELLLVAEK